MSKKTKWSVAGVFAAVIVGVIVLTAMRSGTKAVSVRIEPVQRRDLIASSQKFARPHAGRFVPLRR